MLSVSPPSLLLALLCGLVAAAAAAAFVAYFSTRLREIYFAITTLIFSQIFHLDGGDRRRERADLQPAAAGDPWALLGSLYARYAALVRARG
ncbi:MAG TPA: hypothetical protein VJ349_18305, partial [Stellaceae bacterium]|nr:hypothetical protein [Stellaceae bacterium]